MTKTQTLDALLKLTRVVEVFDHNRGDLPGGVYYPTVEVRDALDADIRNWLRPKSRRKRA